MQADQNERAWLGLTYLAVFERVFKIGIVLEETEAHFVIVGVQVAEQYRSMSWSACLVDELAQFVQLADAVRKVAIGEVVLDLVLVIVGM